jgi:hypothetical protein
VLIFNREGAAALLAMTIPLIPDLSSRPAFSPSVDHPASLVLISEKVNTISFFCKIDLQPRIFLDMPPLDIHITSI